MSIWGAHACSVLAMAFCHRELFPITSMSMSKIKRKSQIKRSY
jgi:hypothetical protein